MDYKGNPSKIEKEKHEVPPKVLTFIYSCSMEGQERGGQVYTSLLNHARPNALNMGEYFARGVPLAEHLALMLMRIRASSHNLCGCRGLQAGSLSEVPI